MYTAKFESWPPFSPSLPTTCGKQLFGSTLWRDRNHRSLSTLLSVYLIEGTFSRNEPAYGAYAQRGGCLKQNRNHAYAPCASVCDPNESKFRTLLEGRRHQAAITFLYMHSMLHVAAHNGENHSISGRLGCLRFGGSGKIY